MENITLDDARRIVWNYLRLSEPLPRAVDLVIVLGSRDDRVASYAADMLDHVETKHVVITGGNAHHGDLLAPPDWDGLSEAAHFAKVMRSHEYNRPLILEETAANTGENVIKVAEIVAKQNIPADTLLIVTKPYMMRRALLTFQKQWPQNFSKLFVGSWQCSFDEYVDLEQPAVVVTNIMVGDLQRIIEYPARGLMTSTVVPSEVQGAYRVLVNAGFTKHLL